MSADKEEKFDKMLYRALKRHSEPVPADFTDRLLRQIREAEEQEILARVVMEERLTLAGCIALGITAIVAAAIFPNIAVSCKELVGTSIDKVAQIVRMAYATTEGLSRSPVRYDWQVYMVFAGVFGFVVCSLVDLLVSDS
ncbi:MAG: hypothetical protein ABSG99_07560 [Sedimentisphaerales bacterium]